MRPQRHHTPRPSHEILVLPDPAAAGRAAALLLVREAQRAIARRGRFVVAVPGGESPRAMLAALARAGRETGLDWRRVTFVWVDERRVPYRDAASNYGAALRSGLRRLAGATLLPMPVSGTPDGDARTYERTLLSLLRSPLRSPGGRPRPIDLVVLGAGADGHVASLFAGSPALAARRRWVVPALAPTGVRERLTVTLAPLRAARLRLILAAGEAKRAIVARALAGPASEPPLPIDLVAASRGRTIWLLDEAAAGSG